MAGVGLITSFLTLSALSVGDFGRYQLVLAAIAFIGTFSIDFFDEIIQSDISRSLAGRRPDEAKRLFLEFAFLKVGLGLAVTLALFFGAHLVVRAYAASGPASSGASSGIADFVRIASFVFVIRALRSTASLFLKSVVSLKALGASAVEELIKLAIIAALFYVSALGVREVLIATVVAAGGSLIYVLMPFGRAYQKTFSAVRSSPRSLFAAVVKGYGWLVLFRTALHQAAKPIRPWLVKAFVGTEAVALYALAANMATLLKDFFPLANVSLVAWEVGNPERLKTIFTRGAKYSFWAGIAFALFCLAAVPLAIWLVLPKYLPAIPLFLALLISFPFHGISRLEYSLLTALREQKVLTARLLAELAISTVTLILLLPVLGILAVAVEVNGAILWRVWYLQRVLGRKYPFLKLRVSSLFRFDAEDLAIFRRGLAEARSLFGLRA